MSEQVITQVGKTRNVIGYALRWPVIYQLLYHLLNKNGATVSRRHSCYWPFQPLGLLVWTLRLGLVMKQIQQEQAPLKYNQTIPWYKTQTEVGIHYHECQRKLNNCKILLWFRNKRTIEKDVTVTLYHTAGKHSVEYCQEKVSEIVYKPSCSSPVPSGAAEASPSVVPIPSSHLISLPIWGSGPFSGLSPSVEWGMNKFRKTLERMLKINLSVY